MPYVILLLRVLIITVVAIPVLAISPFLMVALGLVASVVGITMLISWAFRPESVEDKQDLYALPIGLALVAVGWWLSYTLYGIGLHT